MDAKRAPGTPSALPTRAATIMAPQLSLTASNMANCKPGELMLDDEEVSWVTARIVDDLRRNPQPDAVIRSARLSLVDVDKKAGATSQVATLHAAQAGSKVEVSNASSSGKLPPSNTSASESINVKVARRRTDKGAVQSESVVVPMSSPPISSASVLPTTSSGTPVTSAATPVPAGPELGKIIPESLQVIEVDSEGEKSAAYELHLSKNTFHEERSMVEMRIFKGEDCGCRTWVLLQPREGANSSGVSSSRGGGSSGSRGAGKSQGEGTGRTGVRGRAAGFAALASSTATYLAAVTVRINPYLSRQGRWAQVLNMSTRRERLGFGTFLIAGIEELLTQEDVDILVLYPAENGRAPEFWSSIGWSAAETSLLPAEELVPHDKGGPLLPEFDPGTHAALPRWEKRLVRKLGNATKSTAVQGAVQPKGKAGRAGSKNSRAAAAAQTIREVPAAQSRLQGEELQAVTRSLRECRQQKKAQLISCPFQVPFG